MKLVKIVLLYKNVLDFVLVALDSVNSDGVEGGTSGIDFKIIIAVNSCDFLNYVSLERNVLCGSPRRNNNREIVSLSISIPV